MDDTVATQQVLVEALTETLGDQPRPLPVNPYERLTALKRMRGEIDLEIRRLHGVMADKVMKPLVCLRCGYEWRPHNPTRPPIHCARCASSGWNEPPSPLRINVRRPSDPPNPRWTKGRKVRPGPRKTARKEPDAGPESVPVVTGGHRAVEGTSAAPMPAKAWKRPSSKSKMEEYADMIGFAEQPGLRPPPPLAPVPLAAAPPARPLADYLLEVATREPPAANIQNVESPEDVVEKCTLEVTKEPVEYVPCEPPVDGNGDETKERD